MFVYEQLLSDSSIRGGINEILVLAKLKETTHMRHIEEINSGSGSSSNGESSHLEETQKMSIDILDTGISSYKLDVNESGDENMKFRKNVLSGNARKIQGKYHLEAIDNPNYKNIQSIIIPFKPVSFDEARNLNLAAPPSKGCIIKANHRAQTAIKICINTNLYDAKYSNDDKFNECLNPPSSRFHALLYDSDLFLLETYESILLMKGWECTLATSRSELLEHLRLSTFHVILIDDNANKVALESDGIDLVYDLRVHGFFGPIVSLTMALGQMFSSPFFTDSLAKPFVDNTADKLRDIVSRYLYDEILSIAA
jgi:hypothetical protein